MVARLRARIDALHAENRARRAAREGASDAETLRRTEAETLEQLRELGYIEE